MIFRIVGMMRVNCECIFNSHLLYEQILALEQ